MTLIIKYIHTLLIHTLIIRYHIPLTTQSTQLRLIPMLATCYGLHFAKQFLVDRYCEMKRTKDHKLVEEVGCMPESLAGFCCTF